MTYPSGMSQKVRSHGLNAALRRAGQSADSLEVLLGAPALREGGQREIDDLRRSHDEKSRSDPD